MLQPEGYGSIPMDLHISQQGYHPYYRKGHEDSPGPPIVQTRILEMRKEKSRDAARSRRGKENYEFYELAKMLPLPGAITTQLDKASIIRLTISFLKLKEFTAHGDPPWRKEGPSLKSGSLRSRSMSSMALDLFEQHQATHILQSLDGFAFALGADGRFLYVSETVSIYLGLSQVEMTGSSVFDYIHQQDQSELADLIGINLCPSAAASPPASVASDDASNHGSQTPTGFDRPPPTMTLPSGSGNQSLQRSFCVRMKSTLTKRGCHFKSSGYRVVLVLSHLRPQYNFSSRKQQSQQQQQQQQQLSILGLVGLAIALPPPSVNELRLESDMFVTRLTFDFRISHCEPRVAELLDYTAEELTGTSLYTLCHAQDIEKLRKCHVDLLQKGQVMSGYYRLLNKNGGYTWLQSCATVICNTKSAEEETIICINYVLSNAEYAHCVMDFSQLPKSRDLRNDDPSSSERGTSPEGGQRDHSSSGDIESQHKSTSRPENTGSSSNKSIDGKTGEVRSYDGHVNELDSESSKRDRMSRGSEKSSTASPEYPGVVYFEPTNNQSEPVNDSTDTRNQVDSRQRKRKTTAVAENNDVVKSPRPASSSSTSLEVLSMDNGYNEVQNSDLNSDDISRVNSRAMSSVSGSPEKSDKVTRPWTRSPAATSSYDNNCVKTSNAMSVRDLEDVMNRHLPQHNGSPTGGSPDVLMLKSFPPTAGSPTQRPIQWIAGPPAPPTLPATTLLRQIYVSRESVIRSAGAHATRHGCYGDAIQGTLPTPPGGQGNEPPYGDLMLPSAAKLSDSSPSYSTSGATYLDNCNAMTPPSSVSPRDNFNEAAAVAAAAAMPHMRHYVTAADANSLPHLPLKPHQLFVHPGNLDHPGVPYGQQTLSPDQHQSLYHHPSSFHLYHPPPGGSKTALHSTNSASWFCQPQS